MKNIMLFVLALCLCFIVFGGSAFADTAAAEAPAAEKQGVPDAMFGLGECCYEGKGLEKDLDKAAEWYRKALDAGYTPTEEDQAHLEAVLGGRLSLRKCKGR